MKPIIVDAKRLNVSTVAEEFKAVRALVIRALAKKHRQQRPRRRKPLRTS